MQIFLAVGDSADVTFTVKPRDMQFYGQDEAQLTYESGKAGVTLLLLPLPPPLLLPLLACRVASFGLMEGLVGGWWWFAGTFVVKVDSLSAGFTLV